MVGPDRSDGTEVLEQTVESKQPEGRLSPTFVDAFLWSRAALGPMWRLERDQAESRHLMRLFQHISELFSAWNISPSS